MPAEPADAAESNTGAWRAAGALGAPRVQHTATLLGSGKVLVAGGSTTTAGSPSDTAELYDPQNKSWSSTGSLTFARLGHSATLLASGKVLVAGGYNNFGDLNNNVGELYDPATGTWTPTGAMAVFRIDHTATLLPSGKVLVAGGDLFFTPTPSAELYDPLTGTWTSTGPMVTRRLEHTAVLLDQAPCGQVCGKVLVTGGEGERNPTRSATYDVELAELYDPDTGTWAATDAMDTGRSNHSATLLGNGKVLVTGGTTGDSDNGRRSIASAELYDPLTRTWSATATLGGARHDHTSTRLDSGEVLVVGGHTGTTDLVSTELYDPAASTWRTTASLAVARHYHSATRLEDATVLVAGGSSGNGVTDATELYGPPLPVVSVGDVTVPEGDAGSRAAVFTVSLSSPAEDTTTVAYATDPVTAQAGVDYAPRAGTLTFTPGVTSLAVAVAVAGDTAIEAHEAFRLNLSSPSGVTLGDASGSGTIVDNDPALERSLAIGDVSVHEGDAGSRTATFTVSLSKPKANSSVTVSFATLHGTATGTDYSAAAGTLTFAPGATSLTIDVAVNPDAISEGDEVFTVQLSHAEGALISDALGAGSIIDDDA